MNLRAWALILGLGLPLAWLVAAYGGLVSDEHLYARAIQLQGPRTTPRSEGVSPILLVDVDVASLDAMGPWPWPKEHVRDLLNRIAASGARLLVLDLSLAASGNLPTEPAWWEKLEDRTRIVLPCRAASTSQEGDSPCPITGIPSLAGAARFSRMDRAVLPAGIPQRQGAFYGVDSLGTGKGLSMPLVWSDGNSLIPSLALAALLASAPLDQTSGTWWNEFSREILTTRGPIQLDPMGRILFRPFGPPGASVLRVSAKDVLLGKIDTASFRDRLVVVGCTVDGVTSKLKVPLRSALAGNTMARAEATAGLLQQLVEQEDVRPFQGWQHLSALLALLAFVVVWLALRSGKAWIGWIFLVPLCLGFGLLTPFALSELRLWIPPDGAFWILLAGGGTLVLWPKKTSKASPLTGIAPLPKEPAAMPMPRASREETPFSLRLMAPETDEVPVFRAAPGEAMVRGEDGDIVQLGRYVQLKPLANGGMCKVYEAMDPVMDRRVAIKLLRTERSKGQISEARFLREARIAGSLNHPHINTLYDFGKIEDTHYLVLEFIDGQTLSQWIRENTGIRPLIAVPWIRQIAEALDLAHRSQIVHRDVKPSNFMIVRATGAIKLMDFGVARTPDMSLTQAGTTVGTPNYMSPEQLQGSRVGATSDQYAFGVVVYQMLTQRLPFHGEGLTALCNNIIKGAFTPLSVHRPDLAGSIEGVVHKAFSASPEDRFSSCGEFSEAFAKAASR